MKRAPLLLFALTLAASASAKTITVAVNSTRYQTITGFGAACCDGAMCPFGNDTQPVKLLYGRT